MKLRKHSQATIFFAKIVLLNTPLWFLLLTVNSYLSTKKSTQPAITYSKLTIETLEQGVNYV